MFHLIGDGGANGNLIIPPSNGKLGPIHSQHFTDIEIQGDSPSLNFLPHYNDAFTEDLFSQFVGFV
jgi:hypothetical protein